VVVVEEGVERPFLREERQSRNLDWARRRDWKEFVRVWRSLFNCCLSWFNCWRDRSEIFTRSATLVGLLCGSRWEVYFVGRREEGMTW
jgi:hypothetical protein